MSSCSILLKIVSLFSRKSYVPTFEIIPSFIIKILSHLFKVDSLCSPEGHFENINFQVYEGEIFGIAGLVGAGRTELVRAIAGADPIKDGKITLNGHQIKSKSPKESIDKGIILVPEDRKLQGLVLNHSINENIAYSNMESVSWSGWINTKKSK